MAEEDMNKLRDIGTIICYDKFDNKFRIYFIIQKTIFEFLK